MDASKTPQATNTKTTTVVLGVVCIILLIALIVVNQRAKNKQVEYVEKEKIKLMNISNNWDTANSRLEEYRQVNIQVTNQLDTEKRKVVNLTQETKRLEGAVAQLTSERDDLKQQVVTVTKAAADAAQIAEREIARHTAKVMELEKERDQLTTAMEGLTRQIAILEVKISETEKKLLAANNQNDFLVKELNRMRSEKAELERQFNDLKTVKNQVKVLTEEHNVALRLEWMRRGLYQDMKGGERLMRPAPAGKAQPPANYNLDVEMRRGADPTIRTFTNPPVAPK